MYVGPEANCAQMTSVAALADTCTRHYIAAYFLGCHLLAKTCGSHFNPNTNHLLSHFLALSSHSGKCNQLPIALLYHKLQTVWCCWLHAIICSLLNWTKSRPNLDITLLGVSQNLSLNAKMSVVPIAGCTAWGYTCPAAPNCCEATTPPPPSGTSWAQTAAARSSWGLLAWEHLNRRSL